VETVSQPQGRAVKEAPASPATAPAPAPHDVDEVVVVEEEAELVEFHEAFDAEDDDLLAVEVEEFGAEATLSGDSLFTGAEEESFDAIDEVLPEGSTFDRARLMHAEDTSASLPTSDSLAKAAPQDAPPEDDDAAHGASLPGANGAAASPDGADDEQQQFLRKVK
jgi:hypothetical protein